MAEDLKPVNEDDLKQLKERMNIIVSADPEQYHNDFSLRRYLRAFKTVDNAFQAIIKTNKWRAEYGVSDLHKDAELIEKYSSKARVLKHRDIVGRPVVYIPAKNHSSSDRNIDDLTKFIVYCLEDASKRCFEEVVDNLCIVFDLNGFTLSCMDYQVLKNLIWLLSRHYPERLGVCLIINAPTFFSGCWTVIKGWLDENTSSKVTFVNSEMDLCQYLIPDILPTDA
ncbi:CRAL-TRIO domain-containing protein C3H8.02 [Leguminivora glycinivorella]|uniref:CRAL-TRIO domain-containing protein C3H8.02 n=1 Tax=Leguminivora glycinivorella TaxID=1035111 RepID=UPI00200E41B8|nr:CRAL-TRIO domain-containing protein C3H8.02 [Leguminivora glycinivorella]